MPPDFLNSREDALLVWSVVLLAYVLYKDPRGIGGSLLGVVRALLAPRLLLLFASALAYSAGLVYLAWWFGVWHTAALKETIYWFSGTGVILLGQAIMASPTDPQFARRVLDRIVGVTVLIEFAANLYAFPLGVELVLVFRIGLRNAPGLRALRLVGHASRTQVHRLRGRDDRPRLPRLLRSQGALGPGRLPDQGER